MGPIFSHIYSVAEILKLQYEVLEDIQQIIICSLHSAHTHKHKITVDSPEQGRECHLAIKRDSSLTLKDF